MAVEFRCEKCGKRLSMEVQPGAKVKCPYCKAKVPVPAGLASLPQPLVPAMAGAAGPPPMPAAGDGAQEEVVHDDAMMGAMAKLMPWVISVFLHAGVLMVLAFVTIFVMKTTAPAEMVVPVNEYAGSPDGDGLMPGQGNPELAPRSLEKQADPGGWARRRGPAVYGGAGDDDPGLGASSGDTKSLISLYGVGGGGGGGGNTDPAAQFGLITGGGGGRGPRTRFMGITGNAYHICYVVDRSGSMLDLFDGVIKEMRLSIGQLTPEQTFHVIFITDGPALENEARRLVPGTPEYKKSAANFLKTIKPQGQTDPEPALKRAFEVLAQAPSGKGKIIYLLTDGEFRDNDKVLKYLAAANADKSVRINTILYYFKNRSFEKVLGQIAKENGGVFKSIDGNE